MADTRVLVPVADLDDALAHYRGQGWRIDRISPADDPREVDMSGPGGVLRLRREDTVGPYPDPVNDDLATVPENDDTVTVPDLVEELVVSLRSEATGFGTGRAGMGYRDLIPSRLGGRFIASHIRIDNAGPVPDYAHYHHIRFQMIFCRSGWVRVVYEDQGEPFVLEAGDCVLQPPGIRHRVLESSAGLEVVEIGCPAEHDTYADHEIELPTGRLDPGRDFGGQRFVRHVAAEAPWVRWGDAAVVVCRDLGIGGATHGLAGARVVRTDEAVTVDLRHAGEFRFLFVLEGELDLRSPSGSLALGRDDSASLPANQPFEARLQPGTELLEVTLPG